MAMVVTVDQAFPQPREHLPETALPEAMAVVFLLTIRTGMLATTGLPDTARLGTGQGPQAGTPAMRRETTVELVIPATPEQQRQPLAMENREGTVEMVLVVRVERVAPVDLAVRTKQAGPGVKEAGVETVREALEALEAREERPMQWEASTRAKGVTGAPEGQEGSEKVGKVERVEKGETEQLRVPEVKRAQQVQEPKGKGVQEGKGALAVRWVQWGLWVVRAPLSKESAGGRKVPEATAPKSRSV